MWTDYPEVLFGPARLMLLLRDSAIVSSLVVVGTVLSSSLVAFGMARIRFPGREFWFMVLLSTMMLPGVVTIIPRFILFRSLKWLDTWLPLVVPAFLGGGAFNIFLLRQFFMSIPFDYDEAAKIDGASNLLIWRRLLMPLARPALATVAVLTFMRSWNNLLEPVIYLTTYKKLTLPVGLAFFRGQYSTNWPLLMAGATISVIPIIILYLFAQQYFVQGVVMSGIKG